MTIQHWFKARIRDLDAEECLELLENHPGGRIAFGDDRGPTMLPVNYAMDGRDVLISTSAYGNLARWAVGRPVSFEIDDIDPSSESGWSVIVRGRAEQAEYLDLPVDPAGRPYPWAEGTRTFLIRIRTATITGRRLIPV